jgi:hypothetical protein
MPGDTLEDAVRGRRGLHLTVADDENVVGRAFGDISFLVEQKGFGHSGVGGLYFGSIIPPDPTFQNQRLFVPKAALADVQVLGVIGSPLKRRIAKKAGDEQDQLEMFP